MLTKLSSAATVKLLLIGGSITLTYIGLTGVYMWYQNSQLSSAQQQLGELSQALTTVSNTVTSLSATAQRNQLAQAELHKQLQQVTASNGQFHQQLQGLKNDIQHVQTWANTDLPAAISKLQQRPAITGADEYRAWLSTRYPLLPAAQQPEQNRGSSSGH